MRDKIEKTIINWLENTDEYSDAHNDMIKLSLGEVCMDGYFDFDELIDMLINELEEKEKKKLLQQEINDILESEISEDDYQFTEKGFGI